jgi:mono/diheme cytochrome c family protein
MDKKPDEYNKSGLIAMAGSVAFCLLFFIYIAFVHPGVDLKEVPEEVAAEGGLAQGGGAPAVDVTTIAKPWEPNEALVAHGAKVYKTACAVCHGNTGLGDGAAGAALNPPARNLVEGKWKKGGSSKELFVTLQEGIPGGSMASFKHLPKTDRWALVQFIRSITKDKSADDPAQLEAFGAKAD